MYSGSVWAISNTVVWITAFGMCCALSPADAGQPVLSLLRRQQYCEHEIALLAPVIPRVLLAAVIPYEECCCSFRTSRVVLCRAQLCVLDGAGRRSQLVRGFL